MLVPYALLAQVALLSQFVASQPAAVPTYGQSGTTKEFTTLDGRTYIYDFVSAKSAAKPTLLLLHGYPSSRHDWDHQVTALAAEGFGVVSLDLLGFGDTSKPTAIEAYNTKLFSDNLAHILDAEGLQTVIGVGHDWGAQLLAKAVAWYPERFSKLAFVSVPYAPAGKFLDVDAINKLSLETVGFAQFGFWYFFNAWDAAALMRRNVRAVSNPITLEVDYTDKNLSSNPTSTLYLPPTHRPGVSTSPISELLAHG
jgi:pimeloyl-ACP methyl ester carboxylesterase